mmetsp:Transcript_10618/g.15910  ORF Transcript_10618/g.15910 Transcript_10618/m.15910 type:complete len:155 (-) Transcript_10618:107-571(-)
MKFKGVRYNIDGSIKHCLFCDFCSKTQFKNLLHDDDLCVAFQPLKTAGVQHILVVPKHHIKTVKEFSSGEWIDLAMHMGQVGRDLLEFFAQEQSRTLEDENLRMLYHRPPFNSIDHLHLHCIELPLLNKRCVLKYSKEKFYCVEHSTVVKNMER